MELIVFFVVVAVLVAFVARPGVRALVVGVRALRKGERVFMASGRVGGRGWVDFASEPSAGTQAVSPFVAVGFGAALLAAASVGGYLVGEAPVGKLLHSALNPCRSLIPAEALARFGVRAEPVASSGDAFGCYASHEGGAVSVRIDSLVVSTAADMRRDLALQHLDVRSISLGDEAFVVSSSDRAKLRVAGKPFEGTQIAFWKCGVMGELRVTAASPHAAHADDLAMTLAPRLDALCRYRR